MNRPLIVVCLVAVTAAVCIGAVQVQPQGQATLTVLKRQLPLQDSVLFESSSSTNFSSQNNVFSIVPADDVVVDTNSFYNPSTFRYTPKIAGWYRVDVHLMWLVYAPEIDDADISAHIEKNGSLYASFESVVYRSTLATSNYSVGGGRMVFLDGIDDYLTWRSFHSSMDADTGTVSGPLSWVSAQLVRRK